MDTSKDINTVEGLAQVLHEAGREAVAKKATVNPNTHSKFLEWDELEEHMKEGRRIQARYLLKTWLLVKKKIDITDGFTISMDESDYNNLMFTNTTSSRVDYMNQYYGSGEMVIADPEEAKIRKTLRKICLKKLINRITEAHSSDRLSIQEILNLYRYL